MRLIDADKLPLDIMPEDVDKAPTIDAVPVVRCRECSYRLPKGTVCQLSGVTITGDDFCSRGQRKEADHEVSGP